MILHRYVNLSGLNRIPPVNKPDILANQLYLKIFIVCTLCWLIPASQLRKLISSRENQVDQSKPLPYISMSVVHLLVFLSMVGADVINAVPCRWMLCRPVAALCHAILSRGGSGSFGHEVGRFYLCRESTLELPRIYGKTFFNINKDSKLSKPPGEAISNNHSCLSEPGG